MSQDTQTATGSGELPKAVRVADRLRRIVDYVGRWGAWLSLPVIIVTCMDVVFRKLSYVDEQGRIHSTQLWLKEHVGRVFESTVLQELEWHFHAALFTLVLGYGLVYNTHVRIDLIRDNLAFRKKVWLEFAGLTLFMLPYCAVTIFFAFDYVHSSYMVNEGSVSTVGLSHRWLIKSVLVIGLALAVIAGVAAWLQVVTILWGPKDLRFALMTLDWPEQGTKIEGKERVKLEDEYGLKLDAPPPLIKPAAAGDAPAAAAAPPR
jgi:TRAP-type mannitol/chloroaromatic compound transport system permease small subunit